MMNLAFRLSLIAASEASEEEIWRAVRENNRNALEVLLACMVRCNVQSYLGLTRDEVLARIDEAVVRELDWMAVECHRNRGSPEIVDAVLSAARDLLLRFPHFEHGFVLGVPQYLDRYYDDEETMEIPCEDDD